jgi:hypothetical protein
MQCAESSFPPKVISWGPKIASFGVYSTLEQSKKVSKMNQIINMIIRQVMRQLVHRGVNAGFDQVSKVGKRGLGQKGGPDVSDGGHQGNQQAGQIGKSMNAVRRATKF